ncbi:Hydroxyacylglutathione hydrolase [compost metagenome]
MITIDIQEWKEAGIVQVPISMAPPLRQVNSYLLRGPEGITIVDPGPRTEVTENEWEAVWKKLRIHPDDIISIVLTHHHPDHYGLAGYMQSLTGAAVLMSRRAFEEAERMWGTGSTMDVALPCLFRQHGMPEKWLQQLPVHMNSFIQQVTPSPRVTFVSEEAPVLMGGRSWEAVMSGGHAPGHLSFYDRKGKTMLCGDAVLPQISPNISLIPDSEPEPLHAFITALKQFEQYDVAMAFPGHRNPFDYFNERTRILIQHHEQRLLHIEQLLEQQALTGFQACEALFGTRLSIHQMRFAMSETLAHLLELVRQGRAAKEEGDEGAEIRFRAFQPLYKLL